MNKRISFFIVLCLAALLIACVPAFAAAETRAELNDKITYDKGHTTISWTVSGDDPGTWYVLGKVTGNGKAEQQSFLIGMTDKHEVQTVQMIPGKKYEVELLDGSFITRATKVYEMPKAKDFKDKTLRSKSIMIRVTPVKRKSLDDPKEVKALKADSIVKAAQGGSTRYGVKYHIRMPQLVKTRKFFVTIAFESPDGFLKTVCADAITFEKVSHGYQTLWFNMLGDNYFDDMYKTENRIETGTYRVYTFWDGMMVKTMKFKVQ